MFTDNKIWMAQSEDKNLYLLPKMANRHGIIAGATGTGKTVTMKVMAESFSDMGVPVFLCDVKGDLSGMCVPGSATESLQERINGFGIENFAFKSYPTRFWDIFGEQGHPVRVTVSEMGPTLLGRLFGLTEIQTGVLNIVFRVADDNGLLLLDLKDLRAMLQYVGDNRAEFTTEYGNVSAASIGAIQRALLAFEDEGGDIFFGEPGLDITDWMRTDAAGRGYINILTSKRLIASPLVYSTFLLWMVTELYEKLPEVGDPEKPRMIFFFDEAHLLFNGAPKALVQKIVQVVKLIRSKGVGIYFISQSPSDIPNEVLAQLCNRVQHALRAYFLDEEGIPTIVERARILPPQSKMGEADSGMIASLVAASEFEAKYRESYDRESAYEIIAKATVELEAQRKKEAEEEAARKAAEKEAAAAAKAAAKEAAAAEKAAAKEAAAAAKAAQKEAEKKKKVAQQAINNAASSVVSSVSTNIVNAATGGKTSSAGTIAKRAARNALSSVMRSGTSAIIRGLFGIKK